MKAKLIQALSDYARTSSVYDAAMACESIRRLIEGQDARTLIDNLPGFAPPAPEPQLHPQRAERTEAPSKVQHAPSQPTGHRSQSSDKPTPSQLATLAHLGYRGKFPQNKGQAGILIRQLQQRRAMR